MSLSANSLLPPGFRDGRRDQVPRTRGLCFVVEEGYDIGGRTALDAEHRCKAPSRAERRRNAEGSEPVYGADAHDPEGSVGHVAFGTRAQRPYLVADFHTQGQGVL